MSAFIRLDNLYFHYTPEKPIINNLSLDFKRGEFTAIMGPNGSGKTTLGKLLAGILKPVSGNIMIEQNDSLRMSLGQIGSKIGYLFQNPELQIFSNTVSDELSFIPEIKGIPRKETSRDVDGVLRILGLRNKKQCSTHSLSYGEKQRLALATVLINKPGYLVLDEPTTGLDIARKEELVSIFRQFLESGTGISVITHDRSFVDHFKGRLIETRGGDFIESCIK